MNDQIPVPNITCVDKDGNVVPVQTFTGSLGQTVLEAPVTITYTFQPAPAPKTEQLEFSFAKVQLPAIPGYTFPAITEPGTNTFVSLSK